MSFEVVCISVPAKNEIQPGCFWKFQVGDRPNVLREFRPGDLFQSRVPMFEFIEDRGRAYAQEHFSRIDGPDETALLEERYEAEVSRLDAEFRQIVHEVENA
jgi:hypothetical protein